MGVKSDFAVELSLYEREPSPFRMQLAIYKNVCRQAYNGMAE